MKEKIDKTEEEWRQELTPEQFAVTRHRGTERAFTGVYHDAKEPGTYRCVCCGAALFRSDDKYDSGSGWPSFTRAIDNGNVRLQGDDSLAMRRVEAVCSACDAHLGHVFEDGPAPSGQRYCINSAALDLERDEEGDETAT